MEGTISDQGSEPLCWAYSSSRMWTRFIQNVTDEFATIKEGNLKCHTYYDSGCVSEGSIFDCFDREGLASDCDQDNEKVYGLLHAYLFNLLINKFGWSLKTKNGFEHDGKRATVISAWILNNLNDPSLFTEKHIYRVFFTRGKAQVNSKGESIFKRHKKTVDALIHLLSTFHELVQKNVLKMKVYYLGGYLSLEMKNTGSILDDPEELVWGPAWRTMDGTFSYRNQTANDLFQNVVLVQQISDEERKNVQETFMNYLKFALDNSCEWIAFGHKRNSRRK